MASFGCRSLVVAATLAYAQVAGAQQAVRVNGTIVRGGAAAPRPLAAQWVVLHRVGRDKAGPLDSIRSDDRGRYAFQYKSSPDSSVYFASATYAGVAYFTAPFSSVDVHGDDAVITVFDTSSTGPVAHARSRHVVVFAPDVQQVRHVAEIYWIENAGQTTRVAVSDKPSWQSVLPQGATNLRVDEGDVSSAAVRLTNGNVEVFSPLAPGMRQLQIAYEVPAKNFPLAVPVGDSLTVLEVLVEDPVATIRGAKLVRQPPIEAQNHLFQRFLAQTVPQASTFTISSTGPMIMSRSLYFALIVGIVGVALLIGLARVVMAGGGVRIRRRGEPDRATALAHEIAALDARFERRGTPSDAERVAYTSQRDALKVELTAVLAERDNRL